MEKKNEISEEEYERIKKFIHRYSYIDLIIWRNEMITGGNVNSRLFNLINKEILDRAYEKDVHKSKGKSK